jgi:hypothetical protein
MKINNQKILFFLIIFFIVLPIKLNAEIIILSSCDGKKDSFLKNEYILDLSQSLMMRNYVFDDKTYNKHKITDLSIKKKNKVERLIYKDGNKIFTEKLGYPQFFTQLVFETNSPHIKIRTVINNEEAFDLISTCKKVDRFEKES